MFSDSTAPYASNLKHLERTASSPLSCSTFDGKDPPRRPAHLPPSCSPPLNPPAAAALPSLLYDSSAFAPTGGGRGGARRDFPRQQADAPCHRHPRRRGHQGPKRRKQDRRGPPAPCSRSVGGDERCVRPRPGHPREGRRRPPPQCERYVYTLVMFLDAQKIGQNKTP